MLTNLKEINKHQLKIKKFMRKSYICASTQSKFLGEDGNFLGKYQPGNQCKKRYKT